MNDEYGNEDAVVPYEEEEAPKREPVRWNKGAASEHATKLSMASANSDPVTRKSIEVELTEMGRSPTADAIQEQLLQEDKQTKVSIAGEMASESGDPDMAASILQGRMESTDPEQVIEEAAVDNVIAKYKPAISEEEYDAIIAGEKNVQQSLQRAYAEGAEFSGSTAGNVVEFFATAFPGLESTVVARLNSHLKDKYGADLNNSMGAFVAEGEYLDDIKDWLGELSSEEQLTAFKDIVDQVENFSGLLGPNDFIKSSILSSVVGELSGEYTAGTLDTFRYINNAVSLLDVIGVGQLARFGIKGVLGGVNKASNLAKVTRIDPATGKLMSAEAIADPSGDAARALGTTREDAIIENLLLRQDVFSDVPAFSRVSMEESGEIIKRLLVKDRDIASHLTDLEKEAAVAAQKRQLQGVRGSTLWDNASTVTRTDEGLQVAAFFGKTADEGYTVLESVEQLALLQKRFPNAEVRVVQKGYAGEVRATTSTTSKPLRTQDEIVTELRAKLEPEALAKPSRGDTANRLSAAQVELKFQKEMLRGLRNPKGTTKKAMKAKVEARVQKALAEGGKGMLPKTARAAVEKEILGELNKAERAISEIGNADKASKVSREAEANLSRIQQGQFDKLTGEAKKLYKQLSKEKTTVNTTEEMIPNPKAKNNFLEVNFFDDYKVNSTVGFDDDAILGRGRKSKFLADISSGLDQYLSNSFYRAFDQSRGTEGLMTSLLKPFLQASNNSKKEIVRILDEGQSASPPRTYKASEIIDNLPTDFSAKQIQEVLDGYHSVRQMADVAYEILNKLYRNNMLDDGLKHISVGDDLSTVARLAKDSEIESMKVVYDPVMKQMVELTMPMKKKLLEEGKTFHVAKQLFGDGGELGSTRNVLVTKGVDVKELPEKVLTYREGYLPRMYREQYFITSQKKLSKIDGQVLKGTETPRSTVRVAKSITEAKKLAAEMQENAPDLIIDWKNSRELTGGNRLGADLDLDMNMGGLFFSKKGDHLLDVNNKLADVEDVVGSVYKLATAVSRKVELDPVIALMKQRWINTFGDLSPVKGGFPRQRNGITHPTKISDDRTAKAVAMWDYIDMAEGGLVGEGWRANSIKFGEFLEEKLGQDRIGAFFRNNVSEFNPLSKARAATFTSTIALNPARQLFIQTQQALFLAGIDPTYILSGKGYKDGSALMALASGWVPDSAKPAFRKLLDLPDNEIDEAVEAFVDSGLIEAIDSHLIGRDALMSIKGQITNNMVQAGAQKVSGALKSGIQLTRTLGFDTGEMINISTTYMIARRRWMKNNPTLDPKTKGAKFEIAAQTRQLALGMTQVGGFAYQQGWLSLATQFLSVQQKAALVMARAISPGGKFGNQAVTVGEARRIATFQTLLYGASGVGLSNALDAVFEEAEIGELSKEAKQALHGGIYDLVLNGALSVASGTDVDLKFANNIAAGSGMQDTLLRVLSDIGGEKDILTLLAGPSATVGSRVGQSVGMLRNVLGAMAEGEGVDGETLEVTAESILSIMSGYNNLLKSRAMRNTGNWVAADGTPLHGVPIQRVEQMLAGAFGITGYKQEGTYNFFKDNKALKEEFEDVANTYYSRVSKLTSRMSDLGPVPYLTAMQKLTAERNAIERSLGKKDADVVFGMVADLIKQRYDKGDGALVDNLSRMAMNGRAGTGFKDLVYGLARAGTITTDQAEKLVGLNDNMFGVNE